MLNETWIPTPLVTDAERPPVPILEISKPSRRRTLYVLVNFAGLVVTWLVLLVTRRFDRQTYARQVRVVFERMGGLWIKAGQLFALRIDIFPIEICRELSNLQSRALGFSPALAREIVEEELGGSLDQYFDVWEEAPFAAASIGQVHRGRLRQEQAWVAVKIQKPYSAELFGRDLKFIEWVVRAVALLGLWPHMLWDEGLHELREIMREELDFRFEASSTRRMRKNLRSHGVFAPKVFSRYCGQRVLVTEFVPAVLMADYIRMSRQDPGRLEQWLADNNVKPKLLARRMVYSFQRQLNEDNRFHGDMHPGNIGLLRNSRFALIDFGATNFTDRDYLQRVTVLLRAVISSNYAKAADMSFMLCTDLPVIDIAAVHERLTRRIRAWAERTLVKELPFHDKSMDNLTMETMRVLLGARCTMKWAWLRIHRASSTLDASLIALHPGIDYGKVVAQYFQKADRRRAASIFKETGVRGTFRAVEDGFDIPARVQEYAMFQSTLIRRHAQVFRQVTNRFTTRIAWLLNLARVGVMGQAAIAVAMALQHAGVLVLTPILRVVAGQLPPLELPLLTIVLLIDARVWYVLSRLRRELTIPDMNIHRQTVASA